MRRLLRFAGLFLAVSVFLIGCRGPQQAKTPSPAIEVSGNPPKPTAEQLPAVVEQGGAESLKSEEVESPSAEPSGGISPQPNAQPPAEVLKAVRPVTFHEKCDPLLKEFVRDNGIVNYAGLKRKRPELKQLLDEFGKLDPAEYDRWSTEDKIALWINAYNIQMLNIIVQNYPIESSRVARLWWPPNSIRHIQGIWSDYKFLVMDEEFTLSEIERRFFRKQFNDPRVFFAICTASRSSPPLRNEPYTGEKLAGQLDDQARKFLSGPDGLRIDRQSKMVYITALLEPTWFGGEFLDKYGTAKKFKNQQPIVRATLNFILNYIPAGDVNFLEVENYSIKYMTYDWSLNE